MEYENPVDREIKKIEDYLKKSGLSASRFGQLSCANARAMDRVRGGKAPIDTLRAMLEYIRANPLRGGK